MGEPEWHPISTAPVSVKVWTKIDDANGVRNVQRLVRQGGLWWTPDLSLYVYYTPTHWRSSDPTPSLPLQREEGGEIMADTTSGRAPSVTGWSASPEPRSVSALTGDPFSRGADLRAEMKVAIARALLNESEAGGGGFDDLADAVLDCLAYEDVSLVRNYRAAGAQDCGTLAALHNRAATQLEIALAALIKIDRGEKGVREVAGMALLKVALVPCPGLPSAAMEDGR